MTDRSHKRRAFTLVELLVVLGVCSIIMGIGVAAYIGMNRDLAWHASVTTITSLLRAARNSATETRTPVSVIILTDPVPQDAEKAVCTQAYATFVRRIGAWHFEETCVWSDGGWHFPEADAPFESNTLVEGAFSQKATPIGMEGSVPAPGKYGKGITFLRWFDGADVEEPQALIIGERLSDGTYRKLPAYDVREGVRISAWVKPELPPDVETDYCYPIVAKPSQENASRTQLDQQPVYSMMLVLDPDADVRAFRLLAGVRIAGGPLVETVTRPMVRPNTWTHVAMIYSGAELGTQNNFVRVFVNDEEALPGRGLEKWLRDGNEVIDTPSAGGRIAASDQPAMIGADDIAEGYFHGTIDEVIIDGITTSDRRSPPANVLFRLWNCATDEENMYRIDFDRSGRLIEGPGGLPAIALYSSGSKSATLIGVELTGSLKIWSTDEGRAQAEADKWLGAGVTGGE